MLSTALVALLLLPMMLAVMPPHLRGARDPPRRRLSGVGCVGAFLPLGLLYFDDAVAATIAVIPAVFFLAAALLLLVALSVHGVDIVASRSTPSRFLVVETSISSPTPSRSLSDRASYSTIRVWRSILTSGVLSRRWVGDLAGFL